MSLRLVIPFILLALALILHPLFIDLPPRPTRPPLFFAPMDSIRYFTLGYGENISDSLWLRVIQDIDVCEQVKSVGDGIKGKCQNGWVFQMMNTITEITPKFRIVYSLGAPALSVLVDDPQGAKVIFDKGVREFPNDWPISYRAAYHYLEELKQPQTAADLLIRAGRNGAPYWVFSLAGRLYSEEGRALLAKQVLEEALARHKDSKFAKRLKSRLDEVNRILSKAKSDSK